LQHLFRARRVMLNALAGARVLAKQMQQGDAR
jgi:hypothetical protein